MGQISYTIPTAGSTLNSIADPEIATAFQTLLTWANGNVDATNISATLAQAAAVNQGGQTVKGATNIAASESRTNTAYGTLTTPDQVTGIVLPTNGLIQVWYQATWQESAAGTARAALFLGANQVQVAAESLALGPGPAIDYAVAQTNANAGVVGKAGALTTKPNGLIGEVIGGGTPSVYPGDLTTGQIVGLATNNLVDSCAGPCSIFAAAGTYTVSVQFKSSSGSVTAANRKLWVQALSFS